MKFLRSCLAGVFFIAFAAGGLLVGIVLFPLAGFCAGSRHGVLTGAEVTAARRRKLVRWAYRLFVAAARMTGLFRVEMTPEDRKHLAEVRGSVIVANHISLIDVVILIAFLGETTAIAKAAASRNPFYARIVQTVFLVNNDPEQLLHDASRLLNNGVNLIVFPEGTRTPLNAGERKLWRGAAQIAIAANAPVEAVRIGVNIPVLGKRQPWYDVGDHTVVYSLTRCGMVPPPLQSGASRHAAAVAFTAGIGNALFPSTAV